MTTTTTTTTLRDFAATLDYPILSTAAIGSPIPTESTLTSDGSPDDTFDALGDLEGTVANSKWAWDGEGDPRNCNQNSYTLISVREATPAEWYRLRREEEDSDGYLTQQEIARIVRVLEDPERIDRYAFLHDDLSLGLSDQRGEGRVLILQDFDTDGSSADETAQQILDQLHAERRNAEQSA